MIALDTNVIARYLLNDDKKQADTAERLIQREIESGDGCYLSLIVLCELMWVLGSYSRLSRKSIARVVEELLGTRGFVVERSDEVRRAVMRYLSGKADLADYLLGEHHRTEGCRETATFDRALLGDEGFAVL